MVKTTGVCCEPFGDTPHKTFVTVFEVTPNLIEKAKLIGLTGLVVTDAICDACRIRIKDTLRRKSSEEGESSTPSKQSKAAEASQQGTSSGFERPQAPPTEIHLMEVDDTPAEYEEVLEPSEASEASETVIPLDQESKKNLYSHLSEVFIILGLAPIDKSKMRTKAYQEDRLSQFNKKLCDVFFTKVPPPNNDGDQIIEQLKEKFNDSDRNTRIKVLSVLPKDWSVSKIHNLFDGYASRYLIEQTKKLVEKQGILCDTTKKMGSKTLNEETCKKVEEFYRSDDISRACPGLRDYVKHKENGVKVTDQRRMILMNLREAYEIFKKDFEGHKIGFSKFASLRPPECVLAGSTHGIHVTCVCIYHQNVKLIVDALKKSGLIAPNLSYHDLINMILCANPSDKCRMNNCGECPGFDKLQTVLFVAFDQELIEKLKFKQWTNSGSKFLQISQKIL